MLAEALARGQQLARNRMTDRCDITRPGSLSGEIDPDTGLEFEAPGSDLFLNQPCRLSTTNVRTLGSGVGSAGDVVVVEQATLHLPVNLPRLQVGDVATMTSSKLAVNVGNRFRVTAIPIGTDMTALRYQVEVVSG